MKHPTTSIRICFRIIAAVGALAAAWQLCLFVRFGDAAAALDPPGGGLDLSLALSIVVVACLAVGSAFFVVIEHDDEDAHDTLRREPRRRAMTRPAPIGFPAAAGRGGT